MPHRDCVNAGSMLACHCIHLYCTFAGRISRLRGDSNPHGSRTLGFCGLFCGTTLTSLCPAWRRRIKLGQTIGEGAVPAGREEEEEEEEGDDDEDDAAEDADADAPPDALPPPPSPLPPPPALPFPNCASRTVQIAREGELEGGNTALIN